MRNWKSGRVITLCVILLATVFLMFGCQSQKLDFEHCTPNVKPDQFWAKYDLPKVEGAQLCSDYAVAEGRGISFIHYHEGEKNIADFLRLYEDEFTKKGWKLEEIKSTSVSEIRYVSKAGKRFFVESDDCFMGSGSELHRPCISVKILQSGDATKIK
ncbi:hypothetical protein BH20ACI1_BH20ACI1_04120 [soil metagenome]